MRSLQHPERNGAAPPGTVREVVAQLRRRADALSDSQIRFAAVLDNYTQAGLHSAAGYANANDFFRSEFARMSEKSLRMYLEAGCYLRTHKIALEEAIGRGFDRIFLEARAYAALHRIPDPVRDLRDLTAPELRRIANWRPTPNHPDGTAIQATLNQFLGRVITEFGYTTRSVRIATTENQAAVYTPSGKGRLIIRVMPTEQGG